ncbi:MAG: hypothetical protein NW241_10520 [Bacteroidia bacterium]|nr:hypothetical protein [Bacteroidia bacterium]
MKRRGALICSLLALLAACTTADLPLINEAKRFEPEWLTLTEQVTFLDRFLRVADARYERDLREVEGMVASPDSSIQLTLYSLRSQYRQMIRERDAIKQAYQPVRAEFIKEVALFNEWESRLSKGKLDSASARQELQRFREVYQRLHQDLSDLESRLIVNLDTHNSLLRQMTGSLQVFANYMIEYN